MKRFLPARSLAFLCLAFLSLAAPGISQTYPDPETITVNDFAGLLPDDAEAQVVAELDQLRKDTGIEMTVVTLSRKDMFAPDQDVETFAAGLFDQWGIGDKTRNDGILFLILRADREARIELGKGYAGEWQSEAKSVMQNDVLPEFRKEDYVAGIRAGVTGTIETIARPFHAGAEPPDPKDGVSAWWAALIFVPILLVGLFRRLKAKLARCPQCGARGISVQTHTLQAATTTHPGLAERITDCPSCGYHGVTSITLPMLSKRDKSSSGGGFGGGSSGGGGATGKW